MGARAQMRALRAELTYPLQADEDLAITWAMLAVDIPDRYRPRNLGVNASSYKYGSTVHGKVVEACSKGPAKRRVQALSWMKRAIKLAVRRKITS